MKDCTQFSFEYCVESENNGKSLHITQNGAISIEGMIKAKALTNCHGLAGSEWKDGGLPSEDWNVATLLIYNACAPLNVSKCVTWKVISH